MQVGLVNCNGLYFIIVAITATGQLQTSTSNGQLQITQQQQAQTSQSGQQQGQQQSHTIQTANGSMNVMSMTSMKSPGKMKQLFCCIETN